MAILQPLINIAEICAQKGIEHVVVSPGSRSAVLTLAFARHPQIIVTVIADERSAGFVALGIAQATGKTVGVVCTSGSAAYNLSPAVVEAFFQQVPLLIFTADRPKEWIHQQDGQTMYQTDLFGRHVGASYDLPADYTHPDSVWFIERTINLAINLTQQLPYLPVHVNVPIREPFYPKATEQFVFDKSVRIIQKHKTDYLLDKTTWHRFFEIWSNCENKLVAVGQLLPSQTDKPKLLKCLADLSQETGLVVLGDIFSNVPNSTDFVTKHDTILLDFENHAILKPDLLITVGNSFISKSFKQFIKANPPKYHWHVSESKELIDTFQTLTDQVTCAPIYFFERVLDSIDAEKVRNQDFDEEDFEYLPKWQLFNQRATLAGHRFFRDQTLFNEFFVVADILPQLPQNSILQLANSMSVRYANFIGVGAEQHIDVYCNRGTSGIDGCTSTAVGFAIANPNRIVTLITGDIAFFYDRNAFWNQHIPDNLKVILLNNQGGNIFRMIDGPASQPELETYFETPHSSDAKHVAAEFNVAYFGADTFETYQIAAKQFLSFNSKPVIFEITTQRNVNAKVFTDFKKAVIQL